MNKRNPFPGMDPWLELRWGDVHAALCVGIRAALQPDLPDSLQAVAQAEVLLESDDDELPTRYRPDAAVIELAGMTDDSYSQSAAIATVEPVLLLDVATEPTRRWVEIIDTRNGDRVVTAIEILSPGNKKRGRLNADYVDKIDTYVKAGVNVVEIDLLRSSRQNLVTTEDPIPPDRRAEYYTLIRRAKGRRLWAAYPMPLRQPLPTVPIPLRPTDDDIPLALQPVVDRIYIEGGHYRTDYSAHLPRPLLGDDAAWAENLLRARHE